MKKQTLSSSVMFAMCAAALPLAVGCDTGGVGGDPPMDDLPEYIDCIADLSLTGTFAPSGASAPEDGCVPDGTWTLAVAVADPGTCEDVPVETSYEFVVVRDGNDTLSATYAQQGEQEFYFSVSSNSNNGDCKANFELSAADGYSLTILRPIEVDGVIGGVGEYEHYSEPQL